MVDLFLLLSWDRRRVFPSTATTSPLVNSLIARIQLIKEFLNSSGLIRTKTRSNVSADGIPWGSSKNFLNKLCFALPNSAICSKLSALQMTAQIAIVIISISLCLLFIPSWIGYGCKVFCYWQFQLFLIFYSQNQSIQIFIFPITNHMA